MIDYDIVEKSGRIVFFLHGWGGDKNSFAIVKNHIAFCKMVFVSFTGFGKSFEPQKPYSVYDYAIELKKVVDEIAKGEKVCFVCHSFGARVAVKLISLFPNVVEKIMIIDGAGVKPKRGLKYYIRIRKYKKLKQKVQRGLADKKLLDGYGSSDYKKLSPVMKKTFINVVNEDLKNCFKKVNCETYIFWGNKDIETPIYMAKKINKWVKGSKLFIVKNAGHFSYLDNFSYFLSVLEDFLLS